jgi:hypothetical protein
MNRRPRSITLIASVNALAAAFTLLFWTLVAFRLFLKPSESALMDRPTAASTLGFLAADLVVALPLLVLGWIGLLRMSFLGWTAAQLANVLLAVWTRDLYAGHPSPGGALFLPFTVFAIWAFIHLWKKRTLFGTDGSR